MLQNPINIIDPKGLEDFTNRCTGRYALCGASQYDDASTFGNWLRWKLCESSVDTACSKAPIICCDADRKECLDNVSGNSANQAKQVTQCQLNWTNCVFKTGK